MAETTMPLKGAMPRRAATKVTLDDLNLLNERIAANYERLKGEIYKPSNEKPAPQFNASQLAEMCGKSQTGMLRLLEGANELGLRDGLRPKEDGDKRQQARSFTLEEAMGWVKHVDQPGLRYKRKPGQLGAVLATGFFKGGVGKTTISASLAQGLARRGYKVLAIDLDPQGSLSAVLGVDPSTVELDETFTPLTYPVKSGEHRATLAESIRSTYWSGIDIVAGSTGLFAGEFYLPLRALEAREDGGQFNFLEVLDKALKMGISVEYDYIIIDTPPSLSYVTMNGYWAADAVLMPVVPEGLTLQSAVQFWDMFCDLADSAQRVSKTPKTFAWVGVVANLVEPHKVASAEMLKWLIAFFGDYMLATTIPRTEAVRTGGMEMQTVYDISRYVGHHKTYERAREAFDLLVNEIDGLTRRNLWSETTEE